MKKLIAITVLAVTVLTGCEGDYWDSNRCVLLDRNHTFTKATIIYGNTNVVYDVVAWKDYPNEVQLWVKDESSPRGHKVILTHYSRVIMENSNPKYDPVY